MTSTVFTKKIKTSSREKLKYRFIKRCFDIVAASTAICFLAIPMLVIALLIHMDSEGSAILTQERLGRNGVPFSMYKFRSMYLNAEQNGPQLTKVNDERCTRLGRFLRRSHLDELPQLWNILKGEMSLVGPRPERAFFYDRYERDVPDFRKRLVVRPGLTGLAQINGSYDMPPADKLKFDMQYIENQSLLLDMHCILYTFRMLLPREGAR